MTPIRNRSFSSHLAAALLASCLSACQAPTPPLGHYSGTELIRGSDGAISNLQVSGDLITAGTTTYTLTLTNALDQSPAGTVVLSLTNDSQGALSIPAVANSASVPVRTSGSCWQSADGTASFCPSASEITASLTAPSSPGATSGAPAGGQEIWHLDLTPTPVQSVPTYETPQSFTLTQVMALAAKMSFSSRIEYEHVLQAKHGAQAAYLNLLPHLGINDVVNVLLSGPSGLLLALGDLAPFLFPTRWIAADDARIGVAVENDVDMLVQLSVMTQVEGLTYQLKQDQGVVSFYGYLQTRAQSAHDQVWALEQAGTFPAGSTEHLQALLDSMQLDVANFRDVIDADRAAISQALGFFNPEAVIDVSIDAEPLTIDKAQTLSTEDSTNLAVERALELDEMDRLTEIARNQNTALVFNWLDPSGDYTADLGFNLGEQLQIGTSQVGTLQIQAQQIEAGIAQNVFGYVDTYNTAAQNWGEMLSNMALDEQRLNAVMAQITPNSDLNSLDIEGVLQDYLAAGIRQQQMLNQFRIARTQIARALYQGAYSALTPSQAPIQ